jgi:HEAT repeat protein
VDFIGRHGVGREIRVALELPRLGADLVHRVLSVLAKPENPNARGLVLSLATGQFPVVRLVAAAHLGELDGALAGEVVVALGSEDADTRVAAMRAAARHHIPGATSLVARMGEPGVLHELPRREREVVLETLHELDGARAEALAIELAGRHGLISDTRLSELRLTAVELLGRHARSPEALAALRSASAPLWWNSSEVRAAALEAYSRVEERLRCNTRGTAPAEAR